MAGLIDELKRRKVFKVGAAYLVVAWLAVQCASIGFPAFDAPPWALRVFILVALLGFPVAVVMAWVFDTSEGAWKVDAKSRGTRGVVGVSVLLVALAVLWFAKGQPAYRATDPQSHPAAAAAAAPAQSAPAAIPTKSIAVLAFSDLSPQHDQEYFSDGMAEEILNALAQVKDLKVAGRTSAFFYKGKNVDLREIGRALAVAHVLEGSVRKQGDKVRITAQLIQTSDGTHLWSKAYDGDLRDVFQLQENIARAITDELQVVLEGEQKTRLVPVATQSPDAYALYLQATSTFDRRDGPHMGEAIAQLREAIRLDPKYARAWSRLSALSVVKPTYEGESDYDHRGEIVAAARKAIALDPTLAEPWAVMGVLSDPEPGGLIRQRENFERAMQVDPEDITTNFWFGLDLLRTGYVRQGIERIDHALALDPLLPNALRWRGIAALRNGDAAQGEALLRKAQAQGLALASRELGEVEAARGNLQAARASWIAGSRPLLAQLPAGADDILGAGLFGGDAGARAKAHDFLVDWLRTSPKSSMSGVVPLALYQLGDPALALDVDANRVKGDNSDFMAFLWSQQGAPLRASPGFPEYMRKKEFSALWAKYGPPDPPVQCGEGPCR